MWLILSRGIEELLMLLDVHEGMVIILKLCSVGIQYKDHLLFLSHKCHWDIFIN